MSIKAGTQCDSNGLASRNARGCADANAETSGKGSRTGQQGRAGQQDRAAGQGSRIGQQDRAAGQGSRARQQGRPYHSMLLIAWGLKQLLHHLTASDHGEKPILCLCLNMVITVIAAISEYVLVCYSTSKRLKTTETLLFAI